MTEQRQSHRPDVSSCGIAVLFPPPCTQSHCRDTCLYAARLSGRFLYPWNTRMTRVCTQRDSRDAYDTCFVLSRITRRTHRLRNDTCLYPAGSLVVPIDSVMTRVLCTQTCPVKKTANTWQSYGKHVVVPTEHVVTRVCTRRRSRPRRGCTSESKRTHRAGCQGSIKHRPSQPPQVHARSTTGLGFDQVCPLLTSPLRARRPRRTAAKFPRFRVAPLLRARMAISASLGVCWVQMIALAAPVGVATAPGVRILSCSISCN